MLNFNRSGFLVPNSLIASSVNELKSEFVDNIPTPERIKHFGAYINYSNALKQLCGHINLVQWINGSFVTKALKPKDIDVVTFIDIEVITSLGDALQVFKYPKSETDFQVDAYIVAIHPILSKKYNLYQYDMAYWNNQFSKTRRNRAGNKLSKGFLEIIY